MIIKLPNAKIVTFESEQTIVIVTATSPLNLVTFTNLVWSIHDNVGHRSIVEKRKKESKSLSQS